MSRKKINARARITFNSAALLIAASLAPYAPAFAQDAVDTSRSVILSSLALDLDGARHCYHPNNEGLLHNLNGGISQQEAAANRFPLTGNRGYGIAKKKSADKTYNVAYLQADGYYVSQTPTYDKTKADGDATRYADAETIPYIALSPGWKAKGQKMCDVVFVVNLDNGKESAATFGDSRGNDEQTEISLALANALNIPVTTKQAKSYDGAKTVKRYVGIRNSRLKIYYFKKSGDGNGKSPEDIQATGRRLMGRS